MLTAQRALASHQLHKQSCGLHCTLLHGRSYQQDAQHCCRGARRVETCNNSSGSGQAVLERPHVQQHHVRFSNTKRPQSPVQVLPFPPGTSAVLLGGALCAAAALAPGAAQALTVQAEPSNALSLPTWAIHVSSVAEWVVAMALMWRFAEVSGNPRWKGMSWAMLPSFGSAMCACTWHLYYNSPQLDFLVALQALLTVIGNCTCWLAAWRIFKGAQEQQQGQQG